MKRQLLLFVALIQIVIMPMKLWAQAEPYVVLSDDGKAVTFYYDDQKSNRGGKDIGSGNYQNAEIATFDASFANYLPTSIADWFNGCSSLTAIDGITNLNTSNVTNMSLMFFGCSGLTNFDVSGFNTANVTDMSGMFAECSGLTSLDVSGFNTANVTDMSDMFAGCSSLTSLDLSDFNTTNVKYMNSMFDGCSSLTKIYAGEDWSTAAVTVDNHMFYDCTALVGEQGITYDDNHFDHTYAHIDGGMANPGYFTEKNAAASADAEPYVVIANGTMTFYYDVNRNSRNGLAMAPSGLVTWGDYAKDIETVVFDPSIANTSFIYLQGWFSGFEKLTTIKGLEYLNTSSTQVMQSMFMNCKSLVELDLSTFNTENVEDMGVMFNGCSSLRKLNVSSFNTKKVGLMYGMFGNCTSLEEIDIRNFDFSRTGDLGDLFGGNPAMTTVVMPQFTAIAQTRTERMFYSCRMLKYIYVIGNWDLSSVGSSNQMFYGCLSIVGGAGTRYDNEHTDKGYGHIDGGVGNPGYLTDINAEPYQPDPDAYVVKEDTVLMFYYDEHMRLRNGSNLAELSTKDTPFYLDRHNITKVVIDDSFANCDTLMNTSYWFYDASKLTTIDGLANLKTDNVVNMESMFCNCFVLAHIDLSGFNTENVTNMASMFSGCQNLKSLDLSGFNTAKVTNMRFMFLGCSGLTNLDLSGFNTSNVTDMSYMFYECPGLTSLDVSSFNTSNVTDMKWMFYGCSGLTNLDLSGFNTANVTGMRDMFWRCSNLRRIYAGNDWSTGSVSGSESMFSGCIALVGGAGTAYDANHIDHTYAHIDGGEANPGYFTNIKSIEVVGNTDFSSAWWTAFSSNYEIPANYTLHMQFVNHSAKVNNWENWVMLCTADSTRTSEYFALRADRYGWGDYHNADGFTTNWEDWEAFREAMDGALVDFTVRRWGSEVKVTSISKAMDGTEYIQTYTTNVDPATHKSVNVFFTVENAYIEIYKNTFTLIPTEAPAGFEPYAVMSDDGKTVTFYYDDQKASRGGIEIPSSSGSVEIATFDASFANYLPTSTAYWFMECSSLTTIKGIENLNTSNVTDMSYMFFNCSSLANLDLSGFNTSNVTDMSGMFAVCSSLTSLDLSSFNTDKVWAMNIMFTACTNLTAVYVDGGWSTAAVTESNDMFSECTALVGGAGTAYDENHTDYTYAHIDGGTANPGYFTDKNAPAVNDTIEVVGNTDLSSAFWSAFSSNYEIPADYTLHMQFVNHSAKVNNWDNWVMLCTADSTRTPEYFALRADRYGWGDYHNADGFTTNWEDWDAFREGMDGALVDLTVRRWGSEVKVTSISKATDGTEYIQTYTTAVDTAAAKSVNVFLTVENACLEIYKNTISLTPTDALFEPYVVLSDDSLTITFYYDDQKVERGGMDINSWELEIGKSSPYGSATTAVINTSFAHYRPASTANWFMNCFNLTAIENMANLNTANVTDMRNMFFGCSGLTNLDVTGFNTANVTDMGGMFCRCSGLTSLDVSGFNTANVTNMGGMFNGCSGLTSLDVSGFNTANVTNMTSMFLSCSGLTNLDLSSFKTDNVTGMDYMFRGCSGLTNLDLSGFNTAKAIYMELMFNNCSSLTNLDLSGFSTGNVVRMGSMFSGCSGLTSLDLGSFNTANVQRMGSMFSGCSSLKTIFAGNGWSTTAVTNGEDMFTSCTALVGGQGTTYDANHVDYTYAHIDGGAENPGYFTRSGDEPFVLPDIVSTPVITQDGYVVTMTTETEQATIHYTLSNSQDGEQVYTDPLTMTTDCTLEAWATREGYNNSDTIQFVFVAADVTVATPQITNVGNVVKITAATEQAAIYYTLDGTEPTANSTLYADSIIVDQNCTIKAVALRQNWFTSDVATFEVDWIVTGTATFDGLVATVSGDKTLDDAFEAVGGRSEAAKTIAAIRWNKETAMTESDLQGLNNPNLLVYVSAEALAPAGVQNVVVNGVAKSIVLTDTKEGNGNFCVPQPFTAESISYTRNFQQTTQIGVCRGWETIALPFDVQSIKHESKGDIVPFGSTENGTRFWLRRLMPDGLQSAQRIEANMPYVISMPNSEEYTYEFILAGRVTFSAQNATVPVTAAKVTALADSSITMEPTMVAVGRSSTVWALNVGQVRGSNVEGSVFERDYREVRPFEAYTVHRQDNSSSDDDNPSPRMIPLQNLMGSDATGIEDVRWQMSDGRDDHWYDLNGRKLQCKPTKKGVYIWNGHKRVVR